MIADLKKKYARNESHSQTVVDVTVQIIKQLVFSEIMGIMIGFLFHIFDVKTLIPLSCCKMNFLCLALT